MKPPLPFTRSLLLASLGALICTASLHSATDHGVAATIHPLATEAAVQAMRDGGNAIDAAVAAALTLGVVDGHDSGIGGGCFMLIRTSGGKFLAIDGRETAPALITRETFLRDGKADTKLSLTGALAAGVPGSLAAYDYAIRQHGKLTLKKHLLDAAKIAAAGFPIDRTYAAAWPRRRTK